MPGATGFDSMAAAILGDGPPPVMGQAAKEKNQHWKEPDPTTGVVKLHDRDFNEKFTEPAVTDPMHPYKEAITIPEYRATPMTCGDKCAEQDRLARQHCDMIRKRVAQWFKDTGCPSSIRGFKMKSKCGGRSVSAPVAYSSCTSGACG